MPFRSWMFAVSIGLVSASLQAQEQTDSANDGTTAEQQPTQNLPIPLPVRIIEDDEAAEAREARESEAEQREKDDLFAQQGMNAATQAMNEATQSMKRASWVSTVIVGLGTALLIWTLVLTRQANRAAQGAVSATREIGQKQVRAYLSMSEAVVDVEISDEFVTLTFHVTIKNSGQSPARQVNFMIEIENYTVDRNTWRTGGTAVIMGEIGVNASEVGTFSKDIRIESVLKGKQSVEDLAIWIIASGDANDVFGDKITFGKQFSRRIPFRSEKGIELLAWRGAVSKVPDQDQQA